MKTETMSKNIFARAVMTLLVMLLTTTTAWAQTLQLTLDQNYGNSPLSVPIPVYYDYITGHYHYELTNFNPANYPGFPRDGHSIVGWAVLPMGPVVYATNATVTLTSNLTLYAVWDDTACYITLDLNYEGAASGSPISVSSPYTYTPASPTRDGHTFLGWSTLPTGPVEYAPGATITLTGDLTLYAVWDSSFSYTKTSESPKTATLNGYLGNKPEGDLVIPASVMLSGNAYAVTSIGNSAFEDCTGLTSVTIPASVTSIGNSVFNGCSYLASINVDANNANYASDDGVLFNKDKTTVIRYPIGKSGTSYTIPASVESIGNSAFEDCRGLTSVNIPASVTSIGNSAFSGCGGLTSVNIPASVTSIGESAFIACSRLTSVNIPACVTSIGESAFKLCIKLVSITIYATAVPTLEGGQVFDGNKSDRKFYVFDDLKSTYKSNWSKYADAIESIDDVAVSGVTANQNPDKTTDNWSTFYHPQANVKINTEGVKIYKASLSGSSLTLTEVAGNVIKAGQAVVLKAPSEGALNMELTSSVATGDFSGNELKGTTESLSGAAGNIYALNYKSGTGVGFYKLSTMGSLSANKAYLTYDGVSPSNFFRFEDETTGIAKIEQLNNLQFDNWYDLSGRRIANGQKPTAKGVYIHNGKLEVLK